MVTTAIVHVTCPRCGGDIRGARAVSEAQQLACPYCRMELQVPRVGERVIERVVPMAVPVPMPVAYDDGYRIRRPMTPARWIASASIAVVAMIAMIATSAHHHAEFDDTMAVFDRARADTAACEATCKATCPPVPPAPRWRERGGPGDTPTDEEIAAEIADANRTVCEADCELKCMPDRKAR